MQLKILYGTSFSTHGLDQYLTQEFELLVGAHCVLFFLYCSSYIYDILYSCGTAVMYHDVQIDYTVNRWVYVHYL